MNREDAKETEASLGKIKRICRALGIFLKFSIFAFLAIWAVFVATCAIRLVGSDPQTVNLFEEMLSLVSVVVMGPLVAYLIKIGSDVFLDVVRGESPFTSIRSIRMRKVAVVLLVYAVLEAILSPGFAAILQMGGLDLGYRVTESLLGPSIPINMGVLLVAATLWALSLVFEYGVLLQELSDDTI